MSLVWVYKWKWGCRPNFEVSVLFYLLCGIWTFNRFQINAIRSLGTAVNTTWWCCFIYDYVVPNVFITFNCHVFLQVGPYHILRWNSLSISPSACIGNFMLTLCSSLQDCFLGLAFLHIVKNNLLQFSDCYFLPFHFQCRAIFATSNKFVVFFLLSKRNIIKKRKAQSSTHEVYKKGI
jgi:hypothetical protein